MDNPFISHSIAESRFFCVFHWFFPRLLMFGTQVKAPFYTLQFPLCFLFALSYLLSVFRILLGWRFLEEPHDLLQ